jgi:hypothetical protein
LGAEHRRLALLLVGEFDELTVEPLQHVVGRERGRANDAF